MAKNITIYGTSSCKYCEMAKEYFSAKGFNEIVVKNIEEDLDAMAELKQKVGEVSGVPVIDIDGTIINGFDKDEINKALGL